VLVYVWGEIIVWEAHFGHSRKVGSLPNQCYLNVPDAAIAKLPSWLTSKETDDAIDDAIDNASVIRFGAYNANVRLDFCLQQASNALQITLYF